MPHTSYLIPPSPPLPGFYSSPMLPYFPAPLCRPSPAYPPILMVCSATCHRRSVSPETVVCLIVPPTVWLLDRRHRHSEALLAFALRPLYSARRALVLHVPASRSAAFQLLLFGRFSAAVETASPPSSPPPCVRKHETAHGSWSDSVDKLGPHTRSARSPCYLQPTP